MWTQLYSQDLKNQRLAFAISIEKADDGAHFHVVVESKTAVLSPILQANLSVFDGEKQIVSCAVEKTQRDKGVAYEFTVSSKYVAKSKFTFGNMAEANGKPMPAGDFYWFYLGDFANEK